MKNFNQYFICTLLHLRYKETVGRRLAVRAARLFSEYSFEYGNNRAQSDLHFRQIRIRSLWGQTRAFVFLRGQSPSSPVHSSRSDRDCKFCFCQKDDTLRRIPYYADYIYLVSGTAVVILALPLHFGKKSSRPSSWKRLFSSPASCAWHSGWLQRPSKAISEHPAHSALRLPSAAPCRQCWEKSEVARTNGNNGCDGRKCGKRGINKFTYLTGGMQCCILKKKFIRFAGV